VNVCHSLKTKHGYTVNTLQEVTIPHHAREEGISSLVSESFSFWISHDAVHAIFDQALEVLSLGTT
jgi:hypothetical protein